MILQINQNIYFWDDYYFGTFHSKFEMNPATVSVFVTLNLSGVIYDPTRAHRAKDQKSQEFRAVFIVFFVMHFTLINCILPDLTVSRYRCFSQDQNPNKPSRENPKRSLRYGIYKVFWKPISKISFFSAHRAHLI